MSDISIPGWFDILFIIFMILVWIVPALFIGLLLDAVEKFKTKKKEGNK